MRRKGDLGWEKNGSKQSNNEEFKTIGARNIFGTSFYCTIKMMEVNWIRVKIEDEIYPGDRESGELGKFSRPY